MRCRKYLTLPSPVRFQRWWWWWSSSSPMCCVISHGIGFLRDAWGVGIVSMEQQSFFSPWITRHTGALSPAPSTAAHTQKKQNKLNEPVEHRTQRRRMKRRRVIINMMRDEKVTCQLVVFSARDYYGSARAPTQNDRRLIMESTNASEREREKEIERERKRKRKSRRYDA